MTTVVIIYTTIQQNFVMICSSTSEAKSFKYEDVVFIVVWIKL